MIMYSVIVPWHENNDLLRRALESVPKRDDIECLAIEDKDHRGAGYARNQALDKAQGRWLLFLDSDDALAPDAFDQIDRRKDDDADFIIFNRTAVKYGTGEFSMRVSDKTQLLSAYKDRPKEMDYYCRYCYPEPTGKLVKRELVRRENIRFDETSCANDYMFSVLCGLKARKVAFDEAVIYIVTEREGSVSSNYFANPAKQWDRMYVYWRVQRLLAQNGIRQYPFSGMWMMSRNAGPEARKLAEKFRSENNIPRWKIMLDCLSRIIHKRLRIGVPFNA